MEKETLEKLIKEKAELTTKCVLEIKEVFIRHNVNDGLVIATLLSMALTSAQILEIPTENLRRMIDKTLQQYDREINNEELMGAIRAAKKASEAAQ